MKLLRALAVMAAVATLQNAVFGAISLVYEEGPKTGQAYSQFGGLLTLMVTDFEVGTVYTPGTDAGYEGLPAPNDTGLAGGVTTMDGAGASHPTAQSQGRYSGLNGGLEDMWGIAQITSIQDDAGQAVWTSAGKGYELCMIYYGEQDFHVEPINDATTGAYTGYDRVDGINFHVDVYSCPLGSFDATGGAGARQPGNVYPGINDAGQVLELSMVSLPGFINADGEGGGLATEFESRFNFANLTGDGEAWMEITGGSSQTLFDGDAWGVPDAFAMDTANAAILGLLGYDTDADMSVRFGTTPFGPSAWLVTSNDDVNARYYHHMPEPLTMLGVCLGLGSLGVYLRRRRLG